MAKVLTFTASARHGKDTFADFLKGELENKYGKKVIIVHFADVLKFVAKQWYDWDGQKDEKGRTLLQYLGTDVFRKNHDDCWANIVKELILGWGDTVDYILIPDCRFPNEITVSRDINPDNFLSVKIFRPNFDNGLTFEQKNHRSETALNDWDFDVTILNDKDEEHFKNKANLFAYEIVKNWDDFKDLIIRNGRQVF